MKKKSIRNIRKVIRVTASGLPYHPAWLIDVTDDPKEQTGNFLGVFPESRLKEFPEEKVVKCNIDKKGCYHAINGGVVAAIPPLAKASGGVSLPHDL